MKVPIELDNKFLQPLLFFENFSKKLKKYLRLTFVFYSICLNFEKFADNRTE